MNISAAQQPAAPTGPVTSRQARTLLVIPTYNEAGNIERLLREVQAEGLEDVEILVIDDNSPDGTGALADALTKRMPLKVIHRPAKLGIGSAHRQGFAYAIAQGFGHVMTMDADFAHQPCYLHAMLAKAGMADVIVGSRYLPGGGLSGWGLRRRLITYTAHWLTTHVLKLPQDCTGGLRLYDAAVLRAVDFAQIRSEGYAFLIELLFHIKGQGFSIAELPIVINSRHAGESKISRIEIVNAVRTLVRLAVQARGSKQG
ncbi:MAG: polyprenol monophosphomannose synthase [Candidatus Omnitrophica bacterium]|nr:polyprenol monophosphomannose synthase [Candidatus Omnitrophota bacterium]